MTKYPFRPEIRLVLDPPWWRWLTIEGWAWVGCAAACALIFAWAYVARAPEAL